MHTRTQCTCIHAHAGTLTRTHGPHLRGDVRAAGAPAAHCSGDPRCPCAPAVGTAAGVRSGQTHRALGSGLSPLTFEPRPYPLPYPVSVPALDAAGGRTARVVTVTAGGGSFLGGALGPKGARPRPLPFRAVRSGFTLPRGERLIFLRKNTRGCHASHPEGCHGLSRTQWKPGAREARVAPVPGGAGVAAGAWRRLTGRPRVRGRRVKRGGASGETKGTRFCEPHRHLRCPLNTLQPHERAPGPSPSASGDRLG